MRNSVRVTKLTTHSVMPGKPAGPPPRSHNLFTMSNIAPRHLRLEANGARRIRYFLDDHIRNSGTRTPDAPDSGRDARPLSIPRPVLVELNGIEPMTSCLQSRRSPN